MAVSPFLGEKVVQGVPGMVGAALAKIKGRRRYISFCGASMSAMPARASVVRIMDASSLVPFGIDSSQ
jgi:hypothetical protein